jgi:O-antigen/teichoic acid export membrane protein
MIPILLQPFLRRFFSPEVFGTFAVYLSLVGIVTIVSTLRYDDAIVLPKKDDDSANLLTLSVIFNFFISLSVFLILLVYGGKILSIINLPSKFPISILYLIPISAFLLNVYQSFNYWLIRKKKYNQVSLNKLIRRSAEGVAQILFAFLRNLKGLILSDIVGQIANVISIIYQGFRYGFNFKRVNITKLIYVSKKYSEFPKYNLLPSLMNTCSFFLPPIFINKIFSAENAGYFDLTKLVLSIPFALVASSVSNVLLQRIAERFNNKQSFLEELKPVFVMILIICLAEFFAILIFGTELFKIVFGSNWIISGEISKIMVWSFAFNFFISSFSCLFFSMRKIKTYSIWQFFYFMAIISLLLFRNLGFIEFLKVYVLIEVFCYMILTIIMVSLVFNYEKLIKKT